MRSPSEELTFFQVVIACGLQVAIVSKVPCTAIAALAASFNSFWQIKAGRSDVHVWLRSMVSALTSICLVLLVVVVQMS